MPRKEKQKLVIENVLTRFIKPEIAKTPDRFNSLDDVLSLSILSMRDMDKIQAMEIIKYFKIETIRDMAELNPINPIESILPDPEKFPSEAAYEQKAREIIDDLKFDFNCFWFFYFFNGF